MTLTARLSRVEIPSPRLQRGATITILVMQALIAVTGSVVRVTGSGLGCPTWPECFPGSLTPTPHPEVEALRQWIEYGNRLLTGVIGLVALFALAVVWLVHRRTPRRRYLWLAASMPLGVAAQGLIGGVTVLTGLLWWTVGVHFLASMILVWLGVLLVRAVDETDAPPRPLLTPRHRWLPVALAVSAALVMVAGVMVTAAGPHAGDSATPRLDAPVLALVRVHGGLLVVFLGLIVATGLALRATPGLPGPTRRAYRTLVVVVLAQGVLGAAQFQLGVPEALVALHVLGAALTVVATAWFHTHTRVRD